MKRVQIYLTEVQVTKLKKASKVSGNSVSEIIRRGVDDLFSIELRCPECDSDNAKHLFSSLEEDDRRIIVYECRKCDESFRAWYERDWELIKIFKSDDD